MKRVPTENYNKHTSFTIRHVERRIFSSDP